MTAPSSQLSDIELSAHTAQLYGQLPAGLAQYIDGQIDALQHHLQQATRTISDTQRQSMQDKARNQLILLLYQANQQPNASLIDAVKRNNLALVQVLVEKCSADINTVDDDGNTPLHWSVWYVQCGVRALCAYCLLSGSGPWLCTGTKRVRSPITCYTSQTSMSM